ncbi:NACHT domain-containing protein [Burkholderia cenocepacia]|uniref:NACHT domain-containing protein n=1 Tax=Burkholderia cenocepacia TaxID=95486 RepID=UPI001B8FF3BB|nr:hypothetical protein [Burkholderia cenocepacia]MBR7946045.1 hypothetical protein [Burkholderia cenocepacia]
MLLVPRTCTRQSDIKDGPVAKPIPLSDTRALTAYVLLGDPGSGKTEAFVQEADTGGGYRISAGDFLALDHPELQDSTLPVFLDGLDETRAGTFDDRVPLDNIRKKLQQLGCRSFRLSCRAADWLGNPDTAKLQWLLPAGEQVHVFNLYPLTLDDVAAILPANHGIADPQAFITSAERHGLTDLLFNPQTLGMLAMAVGPDNCWPETRLAVYEMACERLAQEHNEEHVAATRKTAPNQDMLHQAAAYLCALQLIADLTGFTRSPKPSKRVLRLNAVPNPQGLPLDEALASRLFKSIGRDVFVPVHRTVAEFLAARCLTDHLREHLTLRRVLTLICGSDGGVVSSMRGLTGWLVSMSTLARTALVRLDSLGALLYGDAKDFSIAEKSTLMERLGSDIAVSASFRWYEWEGRFTALVTPEMRMIVAQRLADEDRSENHQMLVFALLEGLRDVPLDTNLVPLLLPIVRDASWWPAIRSRSLKIYRRWVGATDPSLRTLLDDIRSGDVTDSEDELLGALLKMTYPGVLSSADLPAFLHPPKRNNLIGEYTMFWRHDLDNVDVTEVPSLLDAFAARTELSKGDTLREYTEAVGGLLARVLMDDAEEISDERLLNWLDAACGLHAESLLEKDDKQAIQQWLQDRPHRYFSLLDLALNRYMSTGNGVWHAEARLHGAKAPENEFGWWLAKAQSTADEVPGKELFIRALEAISAAPRLDLEEMLIACEKLAASRGWQDLLAGKLTCSFEQWKWKLDAATHRQKRNLEATERRDFYRARLADFALPLVPLAILRSVADVYERRYYNIEGKTPQEKLTSFFAGDEDLVQAAFCALRNAINRVDLPSVEETLAATSKGKRMVLNAPALISLELAYRDDHRVLASLPDKRLAAVLVAHFVHPINDHGSWVAMAVATRPQCFVDALSAYLTAMMQWNNRSPHVTYLFSDPAYAEVSKTCLLPLLAQFPLRARPCLRGALMDMLHEALKLPTREELLPLVQVRLDAPKVDGPQRACWLAAGLLLAPDRYLPVAKGYLQRRPPAVEYFAEFLHHRREIGGSDTSWPSNVLGFLIEHFAIGCSPTHATDSGWVSPAMNRADLVRQFLNDLASRPDTGSAEQLKRIESMPALAEWESKVREARAAQRIVWRDATYERPTWLQICAALQQGRPSNPAEIAAIVNDTIEDLKEQVCRSDLNLNRQYWNADSHKKVTTPRHEELCRDTLTDQLRIRLERFEVACLPETHHADGKRSDVWCTTGTLGGVPIEVKRDRHSELWTATRGQLIARYATDPRAKGHGIYVVLWFGDPTQIPLPPSGLRPRTSDELQVTLEAGLSEEERRTITIHVLDCSVRAN